MDKQLLELFSDSIEGMRIHHNSNLIMNGVSKKVLFGGASLIGLSRIVPHRNGTFDFCESGKSAFITPVGTLGKSNICWLDMRDLIAWRPKEKAFYQFNKTEAVLMTNPLYWKECRIFPSIMDWFRSDCGGIVVLDWRKFYSTKKGHDDSANAPRPFDNTESRNYVEQSRKAS